MLPHLIWHQSVLCAEIPYKRLRHYPFCQYSPGKTLQASFSEEGLHTTSEPETITMIYRQIP